MIGTKQRIVFVEGTKDSLDFLLYSEVYRESGFHVIPCGGCREVINAVKAKKQYAKLKGIEVYGVIDRDFRVQYEIDSLATDGIFCLKVAEVENLFVVPALLKIMQEQLGCVERDLAKPEELILELFVAQDLAQIRDVI